MAEIIFNVENAQITRSYLTQLLEQLTSDYKNTKQERTEIATVPLAAEEEFTILEELDLLTAAIRGYASQIQARGWIEDKQEAINQLQRMRIFDKPAIAHFYLDPNKKYQQTKAYIQRLDYLRLLMLE